MSALSGPTKSDLTFLTPPADGALYCLDGSLPAESAITAKASLTVPIDDIRGRERAFNLDEHAFEALSNVESATADGTFNVDKEIVDHYYPEVIQLLLQHLGAQEVKILGHGVRRQDVEGQRQPIQFVHSDHTVDVAQQLANEHVDRVQKPDLLGKRCRIISVWRPLKGPVQSMPLAFVASDSLNTDDIFPVQYRFPDRVDWFDGLKYNQAQRWYYWSGMQVDERLLLKCADSALEPNKAGQSPHTAFDHVGTPLGARPRESIEVRALVLG